MESTWDYGVVDAHLSTVLNQYEVLKGQLMQKHQDDCDEILREPYADNESLQARFESLRDMNKRQHALKQELDDEKKDVELLIKKLRVRFQSHPPAPQSSAIPQKVERNQMLSDDTETPGLAESITAELLALEPDATDAHVDGSTALHESITHGDPQDDTQPPLEPLVGISVAGDSVQQPEHLAPFIEDAAPEDPPTARRSLTPPHLHNPPGKRKQPSKTGFQTPNSKRPKTGRPSTGPPLTERTISFDEVHMNGEPEYMHMIVHFEGHNYIMKCEEHQVHFAAQKPITAAAKHLDSIVHNNQSRDHRNAVIKLGYLVTGCTPELIQKHNMLVQDAYANGYRPLRPKVRYEKPKAPKDPKTSDDMLHLATPQGPASTAPHGEDISKSNQLNCSSIPGAINPIQPIAGELYYGNAKPANPGAKPKKFIVMVLPWKQLPPLDERMPPTLGQSPLLREAQRKTCYVYDQDGIVGWMPGYEDNGQHVKKRWFPVLWFEKTAPDPYGWLRAGDLSPYVPHGQSSRIPAESEARALHSRAIARTFFEGVNLQTPTLDDPGYGHREASPMGSEAMDLDSSSSDDESPLMETRRPGLLAAEGQTIDSMSLGSGRVTQQVPPVESTIPPRPLAEGQTIDPMPRRPRRVTQQALPDETIIPPGSPVLLGEAEIWAIPDNSESSRRTDSPVNSADRVTGMAASALLSHQAIVDSVPAASAMPATNPAAVEKIVVTRSERARSTASPSTGRADSADRSVSEARSAQLTPASSVDRFPVSETAPAAANGTPNAPKRMKGGPSSAKNAWNVWAYADGDEELHHYQQPIKLIGSQDGIARAVVTDGPNIVIDAREVRRIDVDETSPGGGKCTVTMRLGSTSKRLVMASAQGRFHLLAVMFKRWFGKFMSKDDCDDDIGPWNVQKKRAPLQGQSNEKIGGASEKEI